MVCLKQLLTDLSAPEKGFFFEATFLTAFLD
jgi:hypothetical protein